MDVNSPSVLHARGSSILSATLSQNNRLISLLGPEGFPSVLVEKFTGEEGVNSSFFFDLDCLTAETHPSFRHWLGAPLCLSIRLADGRMRYWHARLAEIRFVVAGGGLARYGLTLNSWFSLLGARRDCYVFQDKTVQEIAESIFAEYASTPTSAKWRFDLSRPLNRRSLCTQYKESDREFLLRLLAEEGLSFCYEHAQEPQAVGEHVLVVFDNASPRPEAMQARIRFHRSDGSESSDTITQWQEHRAVATNAVTLSSWDYKRLVSTQGQSADINQNEHYPLLESYCGSGAYIHPDEVAALQTAQIALDHAQGAATRYTGTGSVRQLAAGTCFSLIEHDGYPEACNRFIVTSIHHTATNNLPFNAFPPTLTDQPCDNGTYRNQFSARPEHAPLNPPMPARPTASGDQLALVVGVRNAAITTDRDNRVKVQFAWQRGIAPLAGGLNDAGNPSTKGGSQGNAPGDERSGTWIRASQTLAGANWGGVFMPRIGMEVLVGFVEGDIDRPLIVRTIHNGSAIPPFSAGTGSGSNHAGTIKGWHSHNLGGEGWNQWLADDTPAQLRSRLATSYAASSLRMGYDVLQSHNSALRGRFRGEGQELRSDAWAALRAGKGLLLSTSALRCSTSTQMDLSQALHRLKSVTNYAYNITSDSLGSGVPQAPLRAVLAAHENLAKGIDAAQGDRLPVNVHPDAADHPVEAFALPVLAIETPSQLVTATPSSSASLVGNHVQTLTCEDRLETAGHTSSIVAGESVSLLAIKNGFQALSARGPVSIQSHDDQLEILADQALTVTSSSSRIEINSKGTLTLQAGQSAIILDRGNVVIKCPGVFQALGGSKLIGNASDSKEAHLPELPTGHVAKVTTAACSLLDQKPERFSERLAAFDPVTGEHVTHKYTLISQGSTLKRGTTNADGFTVRHEHKERQTIEALVGPSESWTIEYHDGEDSPPPVDDQMNPGFTDSREYEGKQ